MGRKYFDSAALTGLVRVRQSRKKTKPIPALWKEAEALAQKYEYNDHLASLFLTRGYLMLQDDIPDRDVGFKPALRNLYTALIYGLRYNRFLLDALLTGGDYNLVVSLGTYLTGKGKKGQKLLKALQDEWRKGDNEIKFDRHGTLSPLPEDIPLKESERLARQHEPGTGAPQKTVLEQMRINN